MSRRNTLRTSVRINDLIDELAIGAALRLRVDSDTIRWVIVAVVRYLTEEYPSQDLYIPGSKQSTYSINQIHTDLAAGMSIRALCRKHRIGHKTVRRILGARTARVGAPTPGGSDA